MKGKTELKGISRWLILVSIGVTISLFGASVNANAIQGAWLSSCEEWLKDRASPGVEYFEQLNWVLGFFSSYNYYNLNRSKDVFNGRDHQWVVTYLDGFCKHNPKKRPFDGAAKIINVEIEMDEMDRRGKEIERLINLK